MNLQGLTVIFAIILLPIVLVVSVYLQGQIDTIALQTKYDNMLLNSTYDAVSSFERNIANEDLSTVSDSLRSIIEASKNIFFNTLSTNMRVSNASESYFKTYVPALLYTLYDGFYIYSPADVPVLAEKNSGVILRYGDDINNTDINSSDYVGNPGYQYADNVKDTDTNNVKKYFGQILYEHKDSSGPVKKCTPLADEAKRKTGYVLKPYIYYNANYENTTMYPDKKIKISVNYSLDNYISMSGTIGNVYYSKSGYLIDPDLVKYVKIMNNIESSSDSKIIGGKKISGVEFNDLNSTLNHEEEEFYQKYQHVISKLSSGYNLLDFGDDKLIEDFCKLDGIKLELKLRGDIKIDNYTSSSTKKDEVNQQAVDAICYYGKAHIFSEWVQNNLKDIIPKTDLASYSAEYSTTYLNNESTSKYLTSDQKIFDLSATNDPESSTSAFYEHKREVIKSTIQYNLNNAISNYSIMSEEEYEMPMLSEKEWDVILSNVTMVSFMQQLPCKGKTYNNYAIVPSTSSELTVIPDNLYYVKAEESNSDDYETNYYKYHRIACKDFVLTGDVLGYRSIEYLYDRKQDSSGAYDYDHRNFACYKCIVSGNYDKDDNDFNYQNLKGLSDYEKKAYYTVLGKERNNLCKTTSNVENYGFEIFNRGWEFDFTGGGTRTIDHLSFSRDIEEIRSIEIVIKGTNISTPGANLGGLSNLRIELGRTSETFKVNSKQSQPHTIVFSNITATGNTAITLENTPADKNLTECNIVSIKVIYK